MSRFSVGSRVRTKIGDGIVQAVTDVKGQEKLTVLLDTGETKDLFASNGNTVFVTPLEPETEEAPEEAPEEDDLFSGMDSDSDEEAPEEESGIITGEEEPTELPIEEAEAPAASVKLEAKATLDVEESTEEETTPSIDDLPEKEVGDLCTELLGNNLGNLPLEERRKVLAKYIEMQKNTNALQEKLKAKTSTQALDLEKASLKRILADVPYISAEKYLLDNALITAESSPEEIADASKNLLDAVAAFNSSVAQYHVLVKSQQKLISSKAPMAFGIIFKRLAKTRKLLIAQKLLEG